MVSFPARLFLASLTVLTLSACDTATKTAASPAPAAAVAGTPDNIGFMKGQAAAPVTLIEYASPTCPACKFFHDDIEPKLKANYVDTGKVKFVYRPFPIHDFDVPVYLLALCAGDDKFFTVIDDLFANQDGIVQAAQAGALQPALEIVGARHGVDAAEYAACIKNDGFKKILQDNYNAAQRDKLGGTPTFVLNGKTLPFEGEYRTYEGLAKAIDAQLAATAGK